MRAQIDITGRLIGAVVHLARQRAPRVVTSHPRSPSPRPIHSRTQILLFAAQSPLSSTESTSSVPMGKRAATVEHSTQSNYEAVTVTHADLGALAKGKAVVSRLIRSLHGACVVLRSETKRAICAQRCAVPCPCHRFGGRFLCQDHQWHCPGVCRARQIHISI